MSMVADLWRAMEERHGRDLQEWSMDELRRQAAIRDEARESFKLSLWAFRQAGGFLAAARQANGDRE